MNIYLCFFIAILSAAISLILKKTNPEISLCIAIATVTAIFFIATEYIENIMASLQNIKIIDPEIFSIPIKLLGLTIMSKICISVCEDAGEKGLSSAISTVTKFSSILISFPLFQSLLEQVEVVLSL